TGLANAPGNAAGNDYSISSYTSALGWTEIARFTRAGGLTVYGDISVNDEAYGPAWDGKLSVPTKNAVFDVLATKAGTALVSTSAAGLAPTRPGGTTAFLPADGTWAVPAGGGGGATDDTPYGVAWDGVTAVSPSQNATYDKLAAMDTTIAGKANLTGGNAFVGVQSIDQGNQTHVPAISITNQGAGVSGLYLARAGATGTMSAFGLSGIGGGVPWACVATHRTFGF